MDDEIYEIGRVVGFVGKNDVAVFCCEELRAVLTTDWIVGFPSTRSLCPIVYWSGYSRADPDSYSIERPSGISIELRQTRFSTLLAASGRMPLRTCVHWCARHQSA